MTRRSTEESLTSPKSRPCSENVPGAQGYMFNVSQRVWNPATDVLESETTIVIRMEVAGMEQDDLDITRDENLLIIRGRRRRDCSEKGLVFQLVEIPYGRFERVFELPPKLALEDIKADYRDGFLTVQIPKTPATPRLVPITVVPEQET
jgi:HSP20 family protein